MSLTRASFSSFRNRVSSGRTPMPYSRCPIGGPVNFSAGFGRLGTFLNVTLPIGGRIALPSSINTYISILKNTSLLYVISYPELTTTALQINALTLHTVETCTVLAVAYLALVWSMSAGIRLLEGHLALPETR